MTTPFSLPDPSVQSSIQHPITLETWEYVDGVWQVRAEVSDHTHTEFENLTGGSTGDISALNTLVENLQAAIIELNSDVSALENTQFLILE